MCACVCGVCVCVCVYVFGCVCVVCLFIRPSVCLSTRVAFGSLPNCRLESPMATKGLKLLSGKNATKKEINSLYHTIVTHCILVYIVTVDNESTPRHSCVI